MAGAALVGRGRKRTILALFDRLVEAHLVLLRNACTENGAWLEAQTRGRAGRWAVVMGGAHHTT